MLSSGSSLGLQSISDDTYDIANSEPASPVDGDVGEFLHDNLFQYSSATDDNSDFLNFYIPPYHSSATDSYTTEPEASDIAPTEAPCINPEVLLLPASLDQAPVSLNQAPVPLNQAPASEHREGAAVCEAVTANAETIKTLLQWIDALKQTLSDQHRQTGCQVCYRED